MNALTLTSQDVSRLEAIATLFRRSEEEARATMSDTTAGDTFHDESFARSDITARIFKDRVEEIRAIIDNATIINPEEQCQVIQLGSGVQLEHLDDHSVVDYVVVGYALGDDGESQTKTISARGPLGKCIIGAKVGEVRRFTVKDHSREVLVRKIRLPSKAGRCP